MMIEKGRGVQRPVMGSTLSVTPRELFQQLQNDDDDGGGTATSPARGCEVHPSLIYLSI